MTADVYIAYIWIEYTLEVIIKFKALDKFKAQYNGHI
jgi:hypothetical protein